MTAQSKNAYTIALPSDKELVMTRVFNAPRELVFRAHTDPALVAQWMGWRNYTTIVAQFDARPGGKWRYVQRGPDGKEEGFHGEFREIVAPESFSWTWEYEGMPGHVLIEKYAFEEREGKTTLTATSTYDSKEDRDALIATGMEDGANETGDRLEELLARLQA